MIGISILALIGCAAQQKAAPGQAMPEIEETASMEGRPALVNQIGEDFYLYYHDGRHYVIHSVKMARKFKGSGHPPDTRTLIGSGPQGKTVVFEVDKRKAEYVQRLLAQFQTNPI